MALRSLIASLAIACALAVPAAAQEEQALPDPSEPAAQQGGGGLPETGLSAAVLVTAGLALMAGGVAVIPAARRRRTYSSLAWRGAVAARSRQD
jgi:LPXTG-motif cell wall-anchored protein